MEKKGKTKTSKSHRQSPSRSEIGSPVPRLLSVSSSPSSQSVEDKGSRSPRDSPSDVRLAQISLLKQENASGELSPRMRALLMSARDKSTPSALATSVSGPSITTDGSPNDDGCEVQEGESDCGVQSLESSSDRLPIAEIDILYQQLKLALRSQTEQLYNDQSRIQKEQATLQQKHVAFEAVKSSMAEVLKLQESRIKLNVGGIKFVTSLDTLQIYTDSMLGNMFSGKFKLDTDDKGYYFIDRDGTHFRYILNFLRTGSLVVPEDPMVVKELKIEAEFYQIRPLIAALSGPANTAQFSGSIVHKNTRFCSPDRTSVSVTTKGTCRVLIDIPSVYQGTNYWEIRLDKLQNPNCIAVGVTRTTGELSQYVGSTKDGWSIIVMNRDTLKRWSSPLCEEYGHKGCAFREGDRVGMLLDYTKDAQGGVLSFYINGINQGVAFNDLPPHLFPAVSLHSKGDQITLVATELPPYPK
eukprot:TRINITY_DN10680_c0_g1_i2.p1 TRINITY_DN10680_c0_g1~~TRINITY_DN10680_c0_g1_i2.p1  ORF type:complete len:469 (-),score=56.80 TRINITY_DN10680_c0_g1_i2:127-1533(-)